MTALACCLAVITFGQEPAAGIRGVLLDTAGARIPNATVKIEGANYSGAFTTNVEGVFHATQIPPGAYRVVALAQGFRAATIEQVEVSSGKAASLEIPLAVGGVTEQVTVSADGLGGPASELEAVEVGAAGKLVKGAPYAAEVVIEFVQTLADGNRIVRRQATNVYRDSQGRTRKDHFPASSLSRTLLGEAPMGFKVINDPVEGVSYWLDEKARLAQRQFVRPEKQTAVANNTSAPSPAATNAPGSPEPMKKIRISGGVLQGGAIKRVQPPYPLEAKAARAASPVQVQVTIGTTGEVMAAEVVSGHPLLRDVAHAAALQWRFKPTELSGVPVKIAGVLTFNFTLVDENNADSQYDVTALGKQPIEGIECEGTRKAIVIKAGAIGNEQPIEIVSETWFSPDLQVFVLSKQSDPRFGSRTVRMGNVSRAEPDESLFKVPGDYVIKDARP